MSANSAQSGNFVIVSPSYFPELCRKEFPPCASPCLHGLRHCFRRLIMAVAVLGTVFHGPEEALGQRRLLAPNLLRRSSDPEQSYVMLPTPPRELQRSLVKAREAFQEGRHADGIELLDRLLVDPDLGDFFLSHAETDQPTHSFRSEIQQLLGEMPPSAQELYELQHGNDARRRMERALEHFDLDALREISRQYLCTSAGQEATLLLARYHLDQNQPIVAVMHLRRLQSLPSARRSLEPELSVLLAVALQSMGAEDRAVEVFEALQESGASHEVVIRGTPYRLPLDPSELVRLLQSSVNDSQNAATKRLQWTTAQGDGRRDRQCNGGMPLPHWEWYVANSLLEDESQLLGEMQKRFINQEQVALPTTQPVVANGYMLMRTPKLNVGVQMSTGLQRWLYPFEASLFSSYSHSGSGDSAGGLATTPVLLQERTWDDQVHSQVSCDDRHLYFAVDDGTRAILDPSQVHMWQRGFAGEMEIPTIRNQLVALELATEGKIVWAIGGEEGDEPRLADAYFLGPPLAVQGELFVIAELRDEVRLLALDPATGKLRWSQQLVHFESPLSVVFDECRRMGGAVPTFADGILICPTAAEVVVAVDPASRSLLWAHKYHRSIGEDERLMGTGMIYATTSMQPPGLRWADSFAMAARDCVLVTPIESDQLICCDQLTGERRWQIPRGKGLFIGGTYQDIVAIVEQRHVRSHLLESGKEAWPRMELPGGGMPSGRGFVNGQFLFLPTTAFQLLKIDLLSGTIVEELSTDVMLGNLVCHGAYLISYGADAVRAYYLRDHMRQQLTEALAKSPDDPRTLEAYANLLVGDGKLRDAVDILKRCRALQEDESAKRRTSDLLGQTLLMALRQDFSQFADLMPDAQKMFESAPEVRLLLRIEAEGRLRQGDRPAALAAFLRLANHLVTNDEIAWDDSLRHPADDEVRLSEPAWIAAQLRQIAADDESIPADMHESIKRQLVEGITSLTNLRTPRALRMAVLLAPTHDLASKARFELAEYASEQGDNLEAELQWSQLLESAEPGDQQRAALALGDLFFHLDDPMRARSALQTARTLQEASGVDAPAPSPLLAKVESLLESPPFAWRRGEAVIREEPQQSVELGIQHLMFLDWLDATGPTRSGWTAAFDVGSREVILFDDYGQIRCRIPSAKGDPQTTPPIGDGTLFATSFGDLVVVCLGTQLMAIDLMSSSIAGSAHVLWQRDVSDATMPAANGRMAISGFSMQQHVNPFAPDARRFIARNGMALPAIGPLSADTFCFVSGGVLECVDVLTGQVRWRRRGIEANATVFGDTEHVFVSTGDKDSADVYRIIDGKRIDERTIPPVMQHWARRGRHILAFEQKKSLFGTRRSHLTLWDPWTQEAIWSKRFPDGTRGCLVGFDQFAVIEPNGHLQVINVNDGNVHAATTIDVDDRPTNLEVLRSADRYTCFVSRNDRHFLQALQPKNIRLQGPARGSRQNHFTGWILALDRTTGQALWQKPAEIQQFFLPTLQPAEIPILPLYRAIQSHVQLQADRAQEIEHHVRSTNELLCIDLRTGGLVGKREPGPAMGQTLLVRGDPASDSVDILTDRRVAVRVTMSDKKTASVEPVITAPIKIPLEE